MVSFLPGCAWFGSLIPWFCGHRGPLPHALIPNPFLSDFVDFIFVNEWEVCGVKQENTSPVGVGAVLPQPFGTLKHMQVNGQTPHYATKPCKQHLILRMGSFWSFFVHLGQRFANGGCDRIIPLAMQVKMRTLQRFHTH